MNPNNRFESDLPSYSVACSGSVYEIYSPTSPDSQDAAWGRATYALFDIINSQLNRVRCQVLRNQRRKRLRGMFLTEQQVAAAK